MWLTLGARRVVAADAPGQQFTGASHLLQRPTVDRETGGCRSTVQDVYSMPQVRIALRALRTQRIALADEPGNVAGEIDQAQRRTAFNHVRKPRVRAEAGHATSNRRRLTSFVNRLESIQQLFCLRQRRQRRGIEPGEGLRVVRTPAREFEREWREIGLEDFRHDLRRQRGVRRLGPQPIAHARSGAPCPTATLVSRGAGNRHGLEATHAAVGVEALPALQAGIDDDTHAFDGEARLGEVRGDDDFAKPCGRRTQRRILCRGVEIAIQRQDP